MKKITFLVALFMASVMNVSAQFGCDQAVPITDGFNQMGITTPGTGGPEDWVTSVSGTTSNALYWDDDVYLFQFTAGNLDEAISMTIFSINSWNGIGIFTTCEDGALSGRLADAAATTSNTGKTVSAVVGAGQTVYIAVGQWGTPNGLNFNVESFTATPIDTPPPCPAIAAPADGATNVALSGVLTWTAATSATSYTVSVGTTPGGTDIVNAFNVGNVLTYDIPGMLEAETTYYVTINAINGVGTSTGCLETSFTTQPILEGDYCDNAIDLGQMTSPLQGTTAGASNDNLSHCGTANLQRDLFYSVLVPSGSTLIMSQTANDYDSTNVVFYGDCENRTQIDCWDDSDIHTVNWANDTGEDQTVYWIQDGFGSSSQNAGGNFTLEWQVIACTNPVATYAVVSDCDNSGGFMIQVDITDMGSAASITASDDQGNSQPVTDAGQYMFGPYDNGTNVVITVSNDQDGDCSISSNSLTQALCPPVNDTCANAIDLAGETSPLQGTTAGATNDNLSHCGTSNVQRDVYYFITVPSGSTLIISQTANDYDSTNVVFYGDCDNRTQIDCWDDDDMHTVTWANNTGSDQNVFWIQDGYGSSSTNAGGNFTLEWSVIACSNPTATYTVVSDCENSGGFVIDVNLTDMGSAASLSISDDQGNDVQVATDTGVFTFGPYDNGTNVVISVANDQDADCTITSASLTQSVCPPVCAQSEVIANCGEEVTFTISGAGAWDVAACGYSTPGAEMMYSFTPAETGLYSFTITAASGGYVDYFWKEASGTCDTAGWNCIDDNNGTGTDTMGMLQAGVEYWILADGESTTSKTVTFKIDCPLPPAENDECETAIVAEVNADFSCAAVTAGSLVGATPSNVPDNGAGNPDDDVWFSFVATNTTHTFSLLNVTGTPTDLVHEIMSGSCGSLTSMLVSDPNTSSVTTFVPGQTYYVRVFSYATGGTSSTNFNLCIGTPPPPPANDNCSGAIALTVNPDFGCGAVTAGTLSSATASPVPDNGAGNPDDDVWFSFVATATSHRIQMLNIAGSPTDLVHEVMSGDCGTLVSMNISDPNTSNVSNLVIGNTYYVRVFSYATGGTPTTTFSVCVGTPPPPPANDDCVNAIALIPAGNYAGGAVEGTVVGATGSAGAPAPGCAQYLGGDVWYSVVIPDSGSLTLETGPAQGNVAFDSGMALYSGSCGALTLISCDDDGAATDNFSLLSVSGRTPGEVIYVRVWEYSNDESEPFSISAWDASLAAPTFDNDNFRAYPNPVQNVLNLSYTANITKVDVFNLVGQQVMSREMNASSAQLDMSPLAAGTYLVKVMVEGAMKTLKVIKE